ncbi:hypothetical protein [uncultured Dokdonia sp.]|uniref:hypothetical protein n=1 Tax=uncultured Dokdonia sp. TaxID=575653 RepID=UPI002607C033|nr:hypothetical protein [uncultured Dokdonia sp.]
MKKSLDEFKFEKLEIKALSFLTGGEGTNCGTAVTATGGADSDSDNSTGTSDSDTEPGGGSPKPKPIIVEA